MSNYSSQDIAWLTVIQYNVFAYMNFFLSNLSKKISKKVFTERKCAE